MARQRKVKQVTILLFTTFLQHQTNLQPPLSLQVFLVWQIIGVYSRYTFFTSVAFTLFKENEISETSWKSLLTQELKLSGSAKW